MSPKKKRCMCVRSACDVNDRAGCGLGFPSPIATIDQEPGKIEEIERITRKIEILSEYPLRPVTYFAEQNAEISLSENGSKLLHALFSQREAGKANDFSLSDKSNKIYFPTELTDICISYYQNKLETMLSRTISDFQLFANGTVIASLIDQTPKSGKAHLQELLTKLYARAPSYLWWFCLRTRVPAFIPLDDSKMRREKIRGYSMLDDSGQTIVWMGFYGDADLLYVGLIDAGTKTLCMQELFDTVPHKDLIGPCLNTRTVTLAQLTGCSDKLAARTNKKPEDWLTFLFNMHKAYAAVGMWIPDVKIFKEADDPYAKQSDAIVDWNKFHEKYKCGDPINLKETMGDEDVSTEKKSEVKSNCDVSAKDEQSDLDSAASENDEQSETDEYPEEMSEEDYLSKHKDVASVVNAMQAISEYPISPAACFAEQRLLAKEGADILLQTKHILPKELLSLCTEYYVETDKMVLKRIIEQFEVFADRTVVNQVLNKTGNNLGSRLYYLIKSLDRRGPSYLWWFSMRLHLPSFIPLNDDLNMDREKKDPKYPNSPNSWYFRDEIHTAAHDQIVGMFYRNQSPCIGVKHYEREYSAQSWEPLVNAIRALPHHDLLIPCLDTSTLTLEKLRACAATMETRTVKGEWLLGGADTWLRRLFEFFKALTAVRVWISDVDTFIDNEDRQEPKLSQLESMLEWNRFHQQYNFGEPFTIFTKNWYAEKQTKIHWKLPVEKSAD